MTLPSIIRDTVYMILWHCLLIEISWPCPFKNYIKIDAINRTNQSSFVQLLYLYLAMHLFSNNLNFDHTWYYICYFSLILNLFLL